MSESVLCLWLGCIIGVVVTRLWLMLPIERKSNGENIADIMREFNERQRIENETWKTTTHYPRGESTY